MSRRKSPARSSQEEWRQNDLPGFEDGYYTAALGNVPEAGAALLASLDDEQKLLRSLVLRVAASLSLKDKSMDDESAIKSVVQMIQTIVSLERTKIAARGKDGELSQTILEAIRSLDPYEEL